MLHLDMDLTGARILELCVDLLESLDIPGSGLIVFYVKCREDTIETVTHSTHASPQIRNNRYITCPTIPQIPFPDTIKTVNFNHMSPHLI
ncbi:hypothetical protein L195_g050537 [Trifolium pratense]|uniref:Uncharacterized protein n=1 Tax=Trifolium pratense TaxID=57577 RepID=A0A2K3JUG4_TRIPR|nr:hypothetical protein L195_g050537 [Trifolium pratense]